MNIAGFLGKLALQLETCMSKVSSWVPLVCFVVIVFGLWTLAPCLSCFVLLRFNC